MNRLSEAEVTADYVYRLVHCDHPAEYQRPGWPCGGCGQEREEIEMEILT